MTDLLLTKNSTDGALAVRKRSLLAPLAAALVLSTGAGAEMRSAMGVAVFAGMIGVTAFGLFLTPVFYVLLRKLAGNRPLVEHGAHVAPISHAPGSGGTAHPVLAAPRKEHE